MPSTVHTFTPSFNAHQADIFIPDEVVERADGIAPAPYAGDDSLRQLPANFGELGLDLAADHPLEVAHDGGEWVGANGRPHEVVGRRQVGHPVAHRLIDGILERVGARRYWNHLETRTSGRTVQVALEPRADLGPQHFDSEYIEGLTTYVLRTHVDNAFQSEPGAYSGCSDAVLPCTGFRDNALLAKAFCQKNLDAPSETHVEQACFQIKTCPIALLILCEPVWLL